MKKILKALPSIFTSLGLIAGCISVVMSVSRGDLMLAGYFILIAAFFDFIDGFAARLLNSITEFGKQLDSLADVISFGVAPAMILYRLMVFSFVKDSPGSDYDIMHPATGESLVIYTSFLVAVFSALRLAKFNIDDSQVKSFRGLPTPANAIFIAALGFIVEDSGHALPVDDLILNRYFLLAVIALSCFLLVSRISMFSLKFSSFGIRGNIMRYIFLILAVLIFIVYGLQGLAFIIITYVILSLVDSLFLKTE